MDKGQQRITSNDVAKASGVSRATVSYVLNNDPRQSIPEETRKRVIREAEKLGYRPFTPARVLRAGHSQIVLAVLPFEQVDPGLALGLKELETRLVEYGFTLISYVGVQQLASKIHPSANVTPSVIVSYGNEKDPAIASFLQQFQVPVLSGMNNQAMQQLSGKTQVDYLVKQSQRHIVFAAPERQDVQFVVQARLNGVRQGCTGHGLPSAPVFVVPASRPAARAAIQNLLSHQPGPYGICCYNDEVAFAVLAALTDEGISIPKEAAVIGFDNIPLAQFSIPALTTMYFDGQQSLDALVENILSASRGEATRQVPQPSLKLIVRDSA
ncbi:LacI family transcriptional regulator [Dictyobacter alpinus]|uniref:LacI family transcriptional regulator n=1 Tax=Dictyobacter alpinus TaxID=2014873 RepID=A0A402BCB0_9CHLR|nr:LacI family DNA-binding transcriptional regulator [Dictyobacter alpinus]GCE28974.1 LacI family transcriptional regulator [Dictyobacter alpinus]